MGDMEPRADENTPTINSAIAFLRDRGERVTRARLAIIGVLDRTHEHLTAAEIAQRATETSSGTHRATIYRALATLGELGLLTHTHVAEGATVYQLAPTALDLEHAHAQCTQCGAIIDIPAHEFDTLRRSLLRDFDFELTPGHAAILGTCGTCAKRG